MPKAEITAGQIIIFTVLVGVAIIGASTFYTSLATNYDVSASSVDDNGMILGNMSKLSVDLSQSVNDQDTHQVNAIVLVFTSIYDGSKLLLTIPNVLINVAKIFTDMIGVPHFITANLFLLIPLIMSLILMGLFLSHKLL